MNRESAGARHLYGFIERNILPFLERRGSTADQVSWAGLLLSGAAGLFFVFAPPLGGILLLLAGLCDVTDGFLARRNGTVSKAGAFLDSVLDRYGEAMVLAGIWVFFYRTGPGLVPASLTVLAALTGSFMVSYTRARGEAVSRSSCSQGFFQRGERLIILAIGGILELVAPARALYLAVLVIAVGANRTAVTRLNFIRKELKAED